MKHTELEPGFLQAFRVYIATRILFWSIIGPILVVVEMASDSSLLVDQVTGTSIVERMSSPNTTRMIAAELAILLLLMFPQVPRRLGRWFVPLTLFLALIPLLIGTYWWPSVNPLQTPFIIFYFVMLVLIAWQYPFQYVVAYVMGLTVFQFWLALPIEGMPVTVNIGWLVLQAAMMLLVGYIIVTLVSIQRDQRSALATAYEHQAAANTRLQRYAVALEELTISRERNRLARELHDTLAHSLSAVTVQLEAVRSLWPVDPDSARDMLDQADGTARTGLTEARRALQDLRATPLQDLGLGLALRELAETAAERAGASLQFQIPERMPEGLSPIAEQGIYRIAQEALENVARHSGAKTLSVSLEHSDGQATLQIRDDGLGTDAADAPSHQAGKPRGFGIRGMRERAELIGGSLQIASEAGKGTKVLLMVPV